MGNTVRSDVNEPSPQESTGRLTEETVDFDPAESFALCIGLDEQAKPSTTSLGNLVRKDTLSLSNSITTRLGIPKDNVKIMVSSQCPRRLLTIQGLAAILVEAAWKVGPKGILIFAFSGHGIVVAPDEYSLMLVNHSKASYDYIVASDFLKLIHEEAKFKGKKVLLILDCCHAGGIPEKLSHTEEGRTLFSAIAACNSYQSSIQLFPLGHSVFTYFLLDALKDASIEPGKIPMRSLYQSIHQACASLSALFVPYNETTKSLVGFKVTPVVISEPTKEDKEQVDALVESVAPEAGRAGRFQLLHSLWTCDQFELVKPSFSTNCRRWLLAQSSATGPLQVLHDLDQLAKPDVLHAALSAMLQSIACIHIYEACPTIGKARQFIQDFTEVCATLDSIIMNNSLDINPITVESGIAYYYSTTKQVTDAYELKVLYDKVMNPEATDSGTSKTPNTSALDKLVESLYPMEELQAYNPKSADKSSSILS